ncbi:DNA-invertase hin [Rubripirellula tenax]|uniref:DNA-invertase hin n=1 Tax=Rubripirellula tenax TaxID=2528015 RepID=A0A5C6E688_9BACT|nr:recombinase family protein [Rubripirellula tenax]TWU44452.1 DNA-invertase hin [Rubripirellula tenax]
MKRNENKTIRCAIYTRKSTEEGLEQEFNSLDAQRESGEAYIASQMHEGWTCVPTRYDDGGYTGGNMDRPALKQLMADIEAGKIDCVVVYKVDRLSRSLLDFSRMMEKFDNAGVSFVSVTQQFNTTCSMGRLTLNILLSFAQFEREIISERTRDKIAASRRKGKWSGGMPLLGYGVDADTSKLVVDPDEAKRVRAIFDLSNFLAKPRVVEDDEPAPEPPPVVVDPGVLPDRLLRVPGFVNEVMDHCLDTAPYPNPVMAFCGALSLLAMLAGRRVRDPGDNRTNLYLLPEPVPPVWPDDYPPGTPDPGPRPPWWPDDAIWPPQPETPGVIEVPPSPHIWPRLPPDHPYHVPPGYSAPDNLPPGHPGESYPGMPDYPVVHPGDWGDDWPSYPGLYDD